MEISTGTISSISVCGTKHYRLWYGRRCRRREKTSPRGMGSVYQIHTPASACSLFYPLNAHLMQYKNLCTSAQGKSKSIIIPGHAPTDVLTQDPGAIEPCLCHVQDPVRADARARVSGGKDIQSFGHLQSAIPKSPFCPLGEPLWPSSPSLGRGRFFPVSPESLTRHDTHRATGRRYDGPESDLISRWVRGRNSPLIYPPLFLFSTPQRIHTWLDRASTGVSSAPRFDNPLSGEESSFDRIDAICDRCNDDGTSEIDEEGGLAF